MPLEFLKPQKKREPHHQQPAKEMEDRMIRRAPRVRAKAVRACVPFKEDCWPTPTYPHTRD